MKHLTDPEIELFRQIRKENSLIKIDDEVYKQTGKHPHRDYLASKAKVVHLANSVNKFEEIGEVETYEQLNENGRFIKWYNTIDKYLQIKQEEIKND